MMYKLNFNQLFGTRAALQMRNHMITILKRDEDEEYPYFAYVLIDRDLINCGSLIRLEKNLSTSEDLTKWLDKVYSMTDQELAESPEYL